MAINGENTRMALGLSAEEIENLRGEIREQLMKKAHEYVGEVNNQRARKSIKGAIRTCLSNATPLNEKV